MRTLVNLLEESAEKFPDNIYLWEKTSDKFEGTTYRETRKRVHAFGAGLMKLGLKHGERVTLLCEERNDWVISELGILYNGAVNVPVSVKLNEPEEILFRLKHSGSRMVITTRKQIKKILQIADKASELEKIICVDRIETKDKRILFMEDIMADGRKLLETDGEKFRKVFQSVKEDDYANICYTSGTTADPKGIILTHRNYTANIDHSGSLHDILPYYTILLILPWDHSFAHTCGIYSLMKYGASLAAVEQGNTPMETLKNIPSSVREVRPHIMLSVPALAKNLRKNIEKSIVSKGGLIAGLFRHALKIAYRYNGLGYNRGRGFRVLLWPLYALYDLILFKKIRAGLGGRLKFFVGGGALLDIELQRFFMAIGIPMYQGYGLTEAAPVISSNSTKRVKMGTSGPIATGMDVFICDDEGKELPVGQKGEIVVVGENVMKGYWKNESATKETIKNGRLHTGDLGYFDKEGYLYVLGRFKSLLIADDGEKFSPEGIEEAFTDNSDFIDQCVMHNNQQPYSVCLLVPNKERIRKFMAADKANESPDAVLKKLEEELARYRTGGSFADMFPQRWLPAAVGILEEGFTEENHFVNSTGKMVRPKITAHYQDLIDYLYTPEAKKITHNRNQEAIRKLMSK